VRPVDFIRPEALLAPDEAKTEEEEAEEEEPDAPKFDYEAWDAAQNNEMEIDQVPVPLVTKDDQTNNHKSLHRKLWDCLYLIVKKPRAENAWQFPQGGFKRGESLREVCGSQPRASCAVRALSTSVVIPWGLFDSCVIPPSFLVVIIRFLVPMS